MPNDDESRKQKELFKKLCEGLLGKIAGHYPAEVTPTYSNWYVGITNNPERRRGEHNVPQSRFYHVDAQTNALARGIERSLSNNWGLQGGQADGSSDDSKYAYVYETTSNTKP